MVEHVVHGGGGGGGGLGWEHGAGLGWEHEGGAGGGVWEHGVGLVVGGVGAWGCVGGICMECDDLQN